jgi:hypothetical protein
LIFIPRLVTNLENDEDSKIVRLVSELAEEN